MKRILLIIFFISFFSATAQKKPSVLRKNPYKKATLYLRNGDTINGFIKLNNFNEIKFKEKEKSDKIKYNYKIVKGLTVHIDSIQRHYQYKIIREEKFRGKVETSYHLLEPILIGKATIYLDDYEAYDNYNPMKGSGGITKNIGYTDYNKDYRFYISKNDSDIVTLLGITTRSTNLFKLANNTTVVSGGKLFDFKAFYTKPLYTISDLEIKYNSKYFKKNIVKYFSDCPDLISKIESNYFDKNGLLSIINFYNNECEE